MKLSVWIIVWIVAHSPSAADTADTTERQYPPPVVDPNLPGCNSMDEAFNNIPKYHLDTACDRQNHNSIEQRSIRSGRYHAMLQSGGVDHIPDEQTAYCPELVENWEIDDYGHDTKLLIENQATTPVVVIWVNKGMEYSAMNSRMTPPQSDPTAILQPGEWASIHTFEGNVLLVRELKQDGGLGNVLVQHRPGIVGFRNRFHQELSCEKPKLPHRRVLEQLPPKKQEEIIKQALEQVDPEPKVVVMTKDTDDDDDVIVTKRDPQWDRSHAHMNERCNIIYKGFRNTLDGCPLHVYYAGMMETTTTTTTTMTGPMTCREEFKFHLGLHPRPDDYMHSWESRTKFEGTFVGHTWVARLASNTDIVVDTYTVQPVIVRDCPDLKHQIQVGNMNVKATAAAVTEVNGIGEIKGSPVNATHALPFNATVATTNVHSM